MESYEHRKLITRALAGVYAGLEHRADPSLPQDELAPRASQRAAHAYDQLAKPRVGQLMPNTLGKAVLVTPSDGHRPDAVDRPPASVVPRVGTAA